MNGFQSQKKITITNNISEGGRRNKKKQNDRN